MRLVALVLLAGCASNQYLLKPPKKPCEVIYSDPARGPDTCITRRQLEEMMRQ